jgi:hypothetical protein
MLQVFRCGGLVNRRTSARAGTDCFHMRVVHSSIQPGHTGDSFYVQTYVTNVGGTPRVGTTVYILCVLLQLFPLYFYFL